MSETQNLPRGAQRLSHTGHRLPRDAPLYPSPGSAQVKDRDKSSTPRRNSSGDSQEIGYSDPKKWFERFNQNPAAFYSNAMDADPPFFQKESDSSIEDDKLSPCPYQVAPQTLSAQSSSADYYRSVIDDLTVEIQKLKEQLKRYKQNVPDMLRKEKLFEIKAYALPKQKRRELETILRDFAAGLEQSSDTSSSQRKKTSKHANGDLIYTGPSSMPQHALSSSCFKTRPTDSAYMSMSASGNSSGITLDVAPMNTRVKFSGQKVENYLQDIPEGLYPRHMAMTEHERKRLVVQRLEQLFTGKIGGQGTRPSILSLKMSSTLAPVPGEGQPKQGRPMMHHPASITGVARCAAVAEAHREARIIPPEQYRHTGKKSRSREDGSVSNSNGSETKFTGHRNSSGSSTKTLPTDLNLPNQRPTRPKDLDPDRVQIPSENMDYIRHLGLVPPDLLAESRRSMQDVHSDADGWIYLNLLYNLAQLHIINVTPDFVRSAVTDWSTEFQLSPNGCKIRWRGGSEGTKLSTSGDGSQRGPETEDEGSSNKEVFQRRQKTGQSTSDEFQPGTSLGKNSSNFTRQISSEDSFHYKPLFIHDEILGAQTSMDDTSSLIGPIEDRNMQDSRWGFRGSGCTSDRRKRRHNGTVVYYSSVPFCTDLSRDAGSVSPTTYMLPSGQDQQHSLVPMSPPPLMRSDSGAMSSSKPLSERVLAISGDDTSDMDIDRSANMPGLSTDPGDESSDLGWDFPWSLQEQKQQVHHLEPCGLGGVVPDDHFMITVTTKRQKTGGKSPDPSIQQTGSNETTDGSIGRLTGMSTSLPIPPPSPSSLHIGDPVIKIDYVSGRIKRLIPVL
ncbi:hypothetical protein S40285_09517 [Stachybotrys chlorohalonatus IBT 40285]|uniref:Frequency clock protein n=1 Tax=Stachybotrys chlorohalonatus (strain IBT 40285) TaxID=1283841 RepID=A0A084QLM1_STAC4|nr:hypothetical protein S40285_09517 [Stachybotrys chlorohalonata IBT 40285]